MHLIGIAMTVLPRPAILVIPAGLGVFAAELYPGRRVVKEGDKGDICAGTKKHLKMLLKN